jgi:hypothetical protein
MIGMRKVPFVLCVATLLGVSLVTPQGATADTIESVSSAQYAALRGANPATPPWGLIYEDADNSELDDLDDSDGISVGDIIRGVLNVQAIAKALPTGSFSPPWAPSGPVAIGAGSGHNQLAAIYELLVVGYTDTDGNGFVTPGDVFSMGAVAVGDRVRLSGADDGRMFEVYESTAKSYDADVATYSLAADGVKDAGSTLWAVAGITGPNLPFYTITITGQLTADVAMSLNFQDDTGPRAVAPLVRNAFGQHLHGDGTITSLAGASGHFYDTFSDTDFVILFAPVPAAFGPGIAMLGVLGLVYYRRRRQTG